MSQINTRPRIGLTPDIDAEPAPETQYVLRRNYADVVLAAGGLPLILTFCNEATACLDAVDAIVVSGGMFDIEPALYGGTSQPGIVTKPERTGFERALLQEALRRDMPILGICNGLQLLAVTLGGKLVQHIPTEVIGALEHKPRTSAAEAHHAIDICRRSALGRLAGRERCQVNSVHHQSAHPSPYYAAVAHSPDGVIEAIEAPGRRFCIGVQWHPEYLTSEADNAIWLALCDAARDFSQGRGAGGR